MITNEEIPYEQQMLHILRSYDRITEENARIKEENAWLKAEISRLNSIVHEKASYYTPGAYNSLQNNYDAKTAEIKWAKTQLMKYLKAHGVELPKVKNFKNIVNLITSI